MADKPTVSRGKPETEYHSAGIPDGPTVWVAGFGSRDQSPRNRVNSLPIVQTPWYDDGIKVSPFFNGPTSGTKNAPYPKTEHAS